MITENEVRAAQEEWGRALVKIGSLKSQRGKCVFTAAELLDKLYDFGKGAVLFKPTKASEIQFRQTREAALSYFVGGNQAFPEDTGFALHPWTKVRFENSGMILEENRAIAMGNYYFTGPDNKEIKVEYTFGYVRQEDGTLKIDLHHSSLPYS